MSDGGGFDPCECLWSQNGAMQRLISLLRSSQGYCTSEECFMDLPGPPPVARAGGEDNTFFFFLMMWMLFAFVLYFLRPNSFLQRGNEKPSNNQGPRQPPPNSPVN